jgi:diphthamide biosynthesis enzyme Dph1/Dph2-like protein
MHAACRQRAHEHAHSVQVYLLADTTFDSTAVDEVAAEHVDTDCIIHYGHATLAPVRRIPTYFVFPRAEASVEAIVQQARQMLEHGNAAAAAAAAPLVVLLDLAYVHLRGAIAYGLKVRTLQHSFCGPCCRVLTPSDKAAVEFATSTHQHPCASCSGLRAGRQRRSVRCRSQGGCSRHIWRSCCSGALWRSLVCRCSGACPRSSALLSVQFCETWGAS